MKRFRYILALAVLSLATSAQAYDFFNDGIFYNIQGDEVAVTYNVAYDFNSYSGNVVIPSSVSYLGNTYNVTAIDRYAFCKSVGLKSVTIPNTVQSIGNYAFEGCSWLTSISIPQSVTSIGLHAFANCTNLATITVASGNTVYDSRNACNAIIRKADNALYVGCMGTIIPSTVTCIDDYAFEGAVKLPSIAINSVTTINPYAFKECLTLTNVNMGTSLNEIDDYAFSGDYRIAQATFPNSLTRIGYRAFSNCVDLQSVTFSNALETIEGSAFDGCESLESLTIPASVKTIGTFAFASCPGLESIEVENGNTVYDSRNNCNAIIDKSTGTLVAGCKNSFIPGTVKALDYGAFYGCKYMTSISIPNSVRNVSSMAFYGCSGLNDIYTRITHFSDFEYGTDLFTSVPTSTCILHVPQGTKRMYESMSQWKEFTCQDDAIEAGDANEDHNINVMDVTYIINLILNGGYEADADANCDGVVNVMDVTYVINRILNGSDNYNAEFAEFVLNDVYRSMHTAGWSTTGNTHQCFGISAYNLMAEVMGDDMIMAASGSGWFWYDATYNVKNRYIYSTWRSYDLWNAYYTWIGNANNLISFENDLTTAKGKYFLGQAYAIRAYSYFMLAQTFARTYKGHESEPCVPLYTGTSFAMNTGAARSTVAQVYQQIDADITKAVQLLTGTTQENPAHMGLPVALGLKSRIALVKEDWSTALSAAQDAITASGKTIQDVPAFMGLNDASAGNVMWGVQIDAEHAGAYASLFAHMNQDVAYGSYAPKQIRPALYNKMSATDARRAWWDESATSTQSYYGGIQQVKMDFSDPSQWLGDYIWMRVEEMYLNAAEAACRLSQDGTAKMFLNNLMSHRDPNYTCTKTGTSLGTLTTDETGSLLEEILLQRRIELWGEAGRVYDIKRLKQGFTRSSSDGWPSNARLSDRPTSNPENYMWVMTIPLAEFDNNPNMDATTDQNPLADE